VKFPAEIDEFEKAKFTPVPAFQIKAPLIAECKCHFECRLLNIYEINKTKVVSSGSDAPGTILKYCSSEFIELYQKAKLIISKGQGNYESLSGENRPIFFLFKAKCPVIAKDVGCEVGNMILKGRRE
jgi:uncharacterized protein with ATP-grasp and redox domains